MDRTPGTETKSEDHIKDGEPYKVSNNSKGGEFKVVKGF